MKIKLIGGPSIFLLGGALALYYCSTGVGKRDVLACSTVFNLRATKVRPVKCELAVAQFYFHRDGTGLTAYKGPPGAMARA